MIRRATTRRGTIQSGRSWWRGVLVGALMLAAGCAHHTTVLSLTELDCASCSDDAVGMVERIVGVKAVRFDVSAAELAIDHDPEVVTADQLRQRLYDAGYDALVGGGKGSYLKGPEFPEGLDVVWLSRDGRYVDPLKHLVTGKVTVVDYGAAWCSPCRKVDAAMITILQGRQDVALRKLDVESWESPLARQSLRGVKALPYVLVFDPAGREVDRISGLDLPRLRAAIEAAAKGGQP